MRRNAPLANAMQSPIDAIRDQKVGPAIGGTARSQAADRPMFRLERESASLDTERPRDRTEFVEFARSKGPFAALMRSNFCNQASSELAARVGRPTPTFNKMLEKAGFQHRQSDGWHASSDALQHGRTQGQVIWSALGIEAIWDWALEQRLTAKSKSALLADLRLRYKGQAEVWSALDEAAAGR